MPRGRGSLFVEYARVVVMQNLRSLVLMSKTFGLSPVKTRLNKPGYEELGTDFYQLSLQATLSVLLEYQNSVDPNVKLVIAIAEEDGLKEWRALGPRFEKVWQGPGTLGTKISTVYNSQVQNSGGTLLLGMDSPQISILELISAGKLLEKNDCVVGPCFDGGFYIFAGKKTIEPLIWESVPWSSRLTKSCLCSRLSEHHYSIAELCDKSDVDVFEDLQRLREGLSALRFPTLEQKKLESWAISVT